MLSSRAADGLLGLDRSVEFSSAPLEHVFLVIHGLGDQYTDSPPWLTSLDSSLRQLQRNIGHHRAPPTLLVPLEYHSHAQESLTRALRPHVPQADSSASHVRVGVSETVGDVLLAGSQRFRDVVCEELREQVLEQLAAVRRARPAYTSGRFSIFAHSTGAVFALHMLAQGMLDDFPAFDALVMAGSPAPAYFALDPDYSNHVRDAVNERRGKGVRVFNVYHPLDPVSYRHEPWITGCRSKQELSLVQAPVRVGQIEKQTLWEEATNFWDGAVQNVMSTLFPRRNSRASPLRANHQDEGASADVRDKPTLQQAENVPTVNAIEGGTLESSASAQSGSDGEENPLSTGNTQPLPHGGYGALANTSGAAAGTSPRKGPLRRNRSYVIPGDSGDVAFGSEVLLGSCIDYELQDGKEANSFDMVTNWVAVKVHGWYWRSTDVGRIVADVARTSSAYSGARDQLD